MKDQEPQTDRRETIEYKKNPLKIAANTLLDKAYEVGSMIMSTYPTASPFLQYALISFGAYLAYKQEELNDFTGYLMRNKERLLIDFNSKEFQDGVFIQLETYLKLRMKDKRLVAQEIFNNFCGSPEKPNFPLERYNDTLVKMSKEGLQYLVFLQKEIMPLRANALARKYETGNYPPPPAGKPREWWVKRLEITEPLSGYIERWVKEVFAPAVNVDLVQMGKEEYRQERVEEKRDDLSNLSLEMEQLGIMRTQSSPVTLGGGGGGSILTPYGLRFIEFIPRTID